MKGKKLFFLSLIILSIAMGYHWFKNKPKDEIKKIRRKVTKPVNIEVPPEEYQAIETSDAINTADANAPETNDSEGETAIIPSEITASETPLTTDTVVASQPPKITHEDPILAGFHQLASTPFDPSPYSMLLAQVGKAVEYSEINEGPKIKPTFPLQAPFVGLIETADGLHAVIDGRLYKAGDKYDDTKIIRSVGTQTISLEDQNAFYVIFKTGLEGSTVATDGTIVIGEDKFKLYHQF